jgi:3-phosphoshikimate 1-carboxyvinyltransferase
MTTSLLDYLGVQVISQEDAIRVFPRKEMKFSINVESDWSAAAFFYCMLSMADKGELFFPGLKKSGIQGDQQVASFFNHLGVLTVEEDAGIRIKKGGPVNDSFYADFTGHPDLALPVIMACGAAGVNGTFSGLDRLRLKESDRINALSSGLIKAGLILKEEFPGTWKISGRLADPSEIYPDDFEDHRVAMTFATLAIKGFTLNLEHPDAVNKSFPGFWKQLEAIGFSCNLSC